MQGGLVFVCGSRDGLMTVSGRKHNTDDVIATVLAVEPMKFIYRFVFGATQMQILALKWPLGGMNSASDLGI